MGQDIPPKRPSEPKRLTGDNKELFIIPGANHTDLYDNLEVIPFGKIESFFTEAFAK